MTLFKNKYNIDSNRLKNWDYSIEGIYFITLVTQNRECIFGSIEEDKMKLNSSGQIIENELLRSIAIRKNWFFHNWIVMSNHIHLLIEIQNDVVAFVASQSVEAHSSASTQTESKKDIVNVEMHSCASLQYQPDTKLYRKPNSILSFIAIFKSVTTKQISGISTIWQSNYHDHIVRDFKTFDKIYQYIKNNPRNWDTDSINSSLQ